MPSLKQIHEWWENLLLS